jgi:hypothetical protein
MARQRPEQAHHALDDLDGRLRFFLLCHGRQLLDVWRPILHYEIATNNKNTAFNAASAALSQV